MVDRAVRNSKALLLACAVTALACSNASSGDGGRAGGASSAGTSALGGGGSGVGGGGADWLAHRARAVRAERVAQVPLWGGLQAAWPAREALRAAVSRAAVSRAAVSRAAVFAGGGVAGGAARREAVPVPLRRGVAGAAPERRRCASAAAQDHLRYGVDRVYARARRSPELLWRNSQRRQRWDPDAAHRQQRRSGQQCRDPIASAIG